jgi:hypothetical protein
MNMSTTSLLGPEFSVKEYPHLKPKGLLIGGKVCATMLREDLGSYLAGNMYCVVGRLEPEELEVVTCRLCAVLRNFHVSRFPSASIVPCVHA